jgi:hypothetical protein
VAPLIREEKRRSIRSARLGTGTLACARCDAPVSIGDTPLSLTDRLTCPYCQNHGPLRDFLSLAAPTRPARVVVRVGFQVREPHRGRTSATVPPNTGGNV